MFEERGHALLSGELLQVEVTVTTSYTLQTRPPHLRVCPRADSTVAGSHVSMKVMGGHRWRAFQALSCQLAASFHGAGTWSVLR